MPQREAADITRLLHAWRHGDEDALAQLMRVVYTQLRHQARRHLRAERPGITLQSTALVHEVYLRLLDARSVDWRDRAHFFAICARMARRILVDAARARVAAKRGGGAVHAAATGLDLDAIAAAEPCDAESLCALEEALERFTRIDPRRARVVELRYFAGLSVDETACALGVSPQTVMRDWRLARAWLARELDGG